MNNSPRKPMRRTSWKFLSILPLIIALALSACAPAAQPTPTAPAQPAEPTAAPATVNSSELILATTTSTQDSGLLDVLIPQFEEDSGYKVKTVAVGSGAAMQMGQEGNADVLLVHSPSAEKTLMADGWGEERRLVMHNDFILVGPASDPAGIKGIALLDAFTAIATAGDAGKTVFMARSDKSGTSTMELNFWKKTNLDPAGTKPAWYIETGQGMGATLTISSEKEGYTLTDRATYLTNKDKLELEILVEGDNALLNVYHVITVNPAKWPKVNNAGAKAFAEWLTSAEVQNIIGEFGKEKFGQSLFTPDAGKSDEDLGLN